VITLQPRVPIGQFQFPEIPAGMLDHSGDFAGVAAKELQEECDIRISENHNSLADLTEFAFGKRFKGMYPSAGGCDEFLRLFVYREEVTRERLEDLTGKLTGDREHGEMITLKIVSLDELWKEAPDAKALSALFLYDKFKKEFPLWPQNEWSLQPLSSNASNNKNNNHQQQAEQKSNNTKVESEHSTSSTRSNPNTNNNNNNDWKVALFGAVCFAAGALAVGTLAR